MGKKSSDKVYRSMAEFERTFFPTSYKKKLEEKERQDPSTVGTGLARRVMEDVKRQLAK